MSLFYPSEFRDWIPKLYCLISVAFIFLFSGTSFGLAFTVNSTSDAHDADLTDGLCLTDLGACSLRAAIEQSNLIAGRDNIFLSASNVYFLALGELDIRDDLIISGLDATIGANGAFASENRAIRIDSTEWLVCDTNNARVMVVDRTGQTVKEFIQPNAGGLQIPAVIADYEEELSFAPQWLYVLGWGSGLHRFNDRDGSHIALDIPIDVDGEFFRVGDLLVLGDRDEILITRQSDLGPTGFGRVLRYDRAGNQLADFVSPGEANVIWPVSLLELGDALPAREIFVLDRTGDRVIAFDENGNFLRLAVDSIHGGVKRIDEPRDMEIGPDGDLYILMSATSLIARFDLSAGGAFVENFVLPGLIDNAADFAFGADGHLYVANTGAANILRYDGRTGKFIDVFMEAESGGIGRPTCLYPRPERADPAFVDIRRINIRDGLLDTSTEGGGGILVGKGGSLKLFDSQLFDNVSLGHGGALAVRGEAEIHESSITGNRAVPTLACSGLATGVPPPIDEGGGAIAVFPDAQLRVFDSTLSGNRAWQGGGIFNAGGDVEFMNSTISGNRASLQGGGLWTITNPADGFGTASLIFSTVTDNFAPLCEEAEGTFQTTGGITAIPTGDIFLQSSIVAGNRGSGTVFPSFHDDCAVDPTLASMESGGGNVIGVGESFNCDIQLNPTFSDQIGSLAAALDPRLGPLQNNGGATETHNLMSDSPAIDGGESLRCTAEDQRGEPRNLDGNMDGRLVCDSGSVEFMPATDIDGVPDSIEDAGRFGGDGNGDGIPDRSQPNVASIPNSNDGRYLTLITSDGDWFASVTSGPNPSPMDTPVDAVFPVGHLSFRVDMVPPDREATVDIVMPSGVRVDTYYKYGETLIEPGPRHWYRFDYDGETGVQFPFPERLVLNFVDAYRGDDDITLNSSITDPGAPSFARTPVSIDFKAAADNVVNPGKKGKLWVALLSDESFDARQINVGSITLGASEAEVYRARQKVEDADGNGYPDLWVQFRTPDIGIACGDTTVILKAVTAAGEYVIGTDSLVTVGCN